MRFFAIIVLIGFLSTLVEGQKITALSEKTEAANEDIVYVVNGGSDFRMTFETARKYFGAELVQVVFTPNSTAGAYLEYANDLLQNPEGETFYVNQFGTARKISSTDPIVYVPGVGISIAGNVINADPEIDPTVSDHIKNITQSNIDDWNDDQVGGNNLGVSDQTLSGPRNIITDGNDLVVAAAGGADFTIEGDGDIVMGGSNFTFDNDVVLGNDLTSLKISKAGSPVGEPVLIQTVVTSDPYSGNFYNLRSNLFFSNGGSAALKRRGAMLGNVKVNVEDTLDYGDLWSVYGLAYHYGSGDVNNLQGDHSIASLRGSGDVNQLIGSFSKISNIGSGTAAKGAGYVVDVNSDLEQSGPITNFRGLEFVSSNSEIGLINPLYLDVVQGRNIIRGITTSFNTLVSDDKYDLFINKDVRIGNNLQIQSDGGTAGEIASVGDIAFYNNVAIDSSPVGIGNFTLSSSTSKLLSKLIVGTTASTTSKLHVDGKVTINDGSQGAGKYLKDVAGDGSGTWTTLAFADIPDAPSPLWTETGGDLYRASKVRIGSTDAPVFAADITGDLRVTGRYLIGPLGSRLFEYSSGTLIEGFEGLVNVRFRQSNGTIFGTHTSIAQEKLDVGGNIHLNGNNVIFVDTLQGVNNDGLNISSNPDTANEGIAFSIDNGITKNLFIEQSGNVGIGTGDPTSLLNVNGGTIRSTGANNGYELYNFSGTFIGNYTPSQFYWRSSDNSTNITIQDNLFDLNTDNAGLRVNNDDVEITGPLKISGLTINESELVAPTFNTSQDDYAPTGWFSESIVHIAPVGGQDITGFDKTFDGDIKIILNVGNSTALIQFNDANSVDENRVKSLPGNLDFGLIAGDVFSIRYSAAINGWVIHK